jgi:hypothetical protein
MAAPPTITVCSIWANDALTNKIATAAKNIFLTCFINVFLFFLLKIIPTLTADEKLWIVFYKKYFLFNRILQ